jgi:hypothetical protein
MRRAAIAAMLIASMNTVARFAQSEELADDLTSILPHTSLVCPDALLRACCDDYCPKRPPCIPCFNRCCGCDDYSGKPEPCIACYRGGCLDCYCPKPCPNLCRPLVADYFTCAKGRAACAEPVIHAAPPPAPIATEPNGAPHP